jgi:hypothetical protein
MRATRDLLRRRNHLMRKRSQLLVHIQNTNSQYNLEAFKKKLAYKANGDGVTERLPRVQDFVFYCRLVKCTRESAVKKSEAKNTKIGNAHLKWAFSEAACLSLRGNQQARLLHDPLIRKHGRPKALSILAHQLGRAVQFMLKRKEPFNMETLFCLFSKARGRGCEPKA